MIRDGEGQLVITLVDTGAGNGWLAITVPEMGGKYSLERWRWPGCSGGFSVLCGKQKKSLVETPLGFCDIEAQGNNLSFGTQNPSYLDMAYFPDNDLHMAACAGDLPFVRLYFTLGKYDVNHRDKDNR